MKELIELIRKTPVEKIDGVSETKIYDVTADSREVRQGSLFFCISGTHVDGHDYVEDAIRKGAVAVVAERQISVSADITVIYVREVRRAMEDMVPYFFDYPSQKLRMVALTGTNGKTTTTHIVAHILHHAGYKTGVIGTIHALVGDKELPTHNTTPDVIDLQRLLQLMVEEQVTHVCMEVSSHALVMGRVAGCEFDTAVFTNLTEDHLDYHKTMDNYAKAKSILFQMVSEKGQSKKKKAAWINSDDPYASVMMAAVSDKEICPVATYGMEKDAVLTAFDNQFTGKSSSFKLKFDEKTYSIETKLAGRFNIYNTMAAIGAALSEGISVEDIIEALADFRSVPGRFELIDEGQPYAVVVDYAHTPDGLEKILYTAQEITKGKVIIVFGCGGDRDRMKRPIMGGIAAKLADVIVITSDNPRTEDPVEIIKEVAAGVEPVVKDEENKKYKIISDRRSAIRYAISVAGKDDMVIIAGKGHEDYQILKDRTIHFDDREEARKALKE